MACRVQPRRSVENELAGREAGPMSRIYLLVEGQTEEAFVNELLVPH